MDRPGKCSTESEFDSSSNISFSNICYGRGNRPHLTDVDVVWDMELLIFLHQNMQNLPTNSREQHIFNKEREGYSCLYNDMKS